MKTNIAQSARAVARANRDQENYLRAIKEGNLTIDKLYFATVVIVAAYSTAGWLSGC